MTDETPHPSPDPLAPSTDGPAFKARFEATIKAVESVMDQYERETPAWEAETLIDLTRGALASFWHYLSESDAPPEGPPLSEEELRALALRLNSEDVDRLAQEALRDPAVRRAVGPSWALPEVELQYAVEWDWEKHTAVSGRFEADALKDDPEKWKEAGFNFFLNARALYVLNLLTRGALIRTTGETSEAAIPPDLLDRFPALAIPQTVPVTLDDNLELSPTPPDEQARAAYEARYRPFVLTLNTLAALSHEWALKALAAVPHADLDLPAELAEQTLTPLELWQRLPSEAQETFRFSLLDEVLQEPYPGDLLHVTGHVNDAPFDAALHVEVHPLVLDLGWKDAPRRAFYPVTLSLVYTGAIPLVAWTDEDRRKLWDAFEETLRIVLDALQKSVRPSPSPSPSPSPEPPEAFPAPAYVGPPPVERKVFPAAFGLTKVDAEALDLIGSVHKVRLPVSRWSSLKNWPDTVEEEIAAILENEGDRAFRPIPDGRGPLLTRRTARGGETVNRLTEEAEHRLKIRKGLGSNGFRFVDPQNGREYLCRVFEFRSGYLEVGLSWFGIAGPWVDEWRKGIKKDAEDHAKQASLFDDLDGAAQARVLRARLLDDSYRLMEAVLGQVGKQRQNPVVVPAEAFRVLLGLKTEPHWKARLEGGLDALRACEFRFRSFDTTHVKGYGSFLAGWQYRGAGPGDHGEGVYLLYVHGPFLGCLKIFESGKREIGGAFVQTFDFSKALTEDAKAEIGWTRKARARQTPVSRFVEFDAGRPFYSAVAGLTPTQEALHRFVDGELTRRHSPVSRTLGPYVTRKDEQLPPRSPDGSRPRVYDQTVCPLLPEGRQYFAALGNFRRNAEAGWTLYGTARRESKTGGAHVPGLLTRMGYTLPLGSGSQAQARADVVKKALGDLKATIEEYLGGVVAAVHSGKWLTLEEAAKLSDEDLGRRTRWFLFVPETYHADRREKFEKATGYTVTEDPEEARRAARRERGIMGLPLRERLRMARINQTLSQAAVGKLFGVSQKTVALWEIGPEPHADGKVRGKPIPLELAPLLERWIAGGTPPTTEELAVRKAGRLGGRKGA